jgi:hypothetical protein
MYNDSNQNSMESVCGVCANQSHNVAKVILDLNLNSDFNFEILLIELKGGLISSKSNNKINLFIGLNQNFSIRSLKCFVIIDKFYMISNLIA